MSFYVTSANRNAVRRLLVSTGLPAADVRNWPTSRLGATLRTCIAEGKLTNDQATQACKIEESEIEFVPESQLPQQPQHNGQPPAILLTQDGDKSAAALANAIAHAVQTAVASVPTGTDAKAVIDIASKLIDASVKAERDRTDALIVAQCRPAYIEIKTGDTIKKVEGRTHAKFKDVLTIISTKVQGRRLHAWLAGPSGSGKSYLAKQAADALGLAFYSTGAIQSKYDLIGFVSPTGNEATLRTPFRDAFEYGGVFSWDDCDASDPRAFVAFNEALSNGRFAFPDKCIEQHADFVAVASANTWGNGATSDYVGRNKIDGATLSRFVRVEVGYDEGLERDMVGKDHATWALYVQGIRKAVTALGVKVLVTPRATLQGAALLAAGMDRKQVEAMTVFAGLDSETENKLRKAA
jgi:cobaltochelatase CobS